MEYFSIPKSTISLRNYKLDVEYDDVDINEKNDKEDNIVIDDNDEVCEL